MTLFDKGYALQVINSKGQYFWLQGDDATQFRAEWDEAPEWSLSKFVSMMGYDVLFGDE